MYTSNIIDLDISWLKHKFRDLWHLPPVGSPKLDQIEILPSTLSRMPAAGETEHCNLSVLEEDQPPIKRVLRCCSIHHQYQFIINLWHCNFSPLEKARVNVPALLVALGIKLFYSVLGGISRSSHRIYCGSGHCSVVLTSNSLRKETFWVGCHQNPRFAYCWSLRIAIPHHKAC
jgi:hypothetical protein